MMLYSGLVCLLFIVVKSASAAPVELFDDRIPPVDLHFTCVRIVTEIEHPDQAPLILLHGLSGTMSSWAGVYEVLALQTGRRVCIVDLRNHGDSPWSNETSVAAMTEDTIHLLDEIGEKKAIIIGHSLGGKIAIHTAINYPDRVEKIVVEDIAPNNLPVLSSIQFILTFMKAAIDSVPLGSDESQAMKFMIAYIKEHFKEFNVTINEEDIQEISIITCSDGKCRLKMNIDALQDAFVNDFNTMWTRSTGIYAGPALFIYGTESEFKVNEEEESILEMFPKAKLVGIKGAGHNIHPTFRQFLDETLKFLKE